MLLKGLNHVAVIGSTLASTLFGPGSDPVGQYINVKNIQFKVVGVLASKGTGAFGVDQDNLVLVPITVGQKQMLGINYFSDIEVQANNAYTIPFVQSRVESILEQDHNITDPSKDDFTIETQQDVLSLLGNITSISCGVRDAHVHRRRDRHRARGCRGRLGVAYHHKSCRHRMDICLPAVRGPARSRGFERYRYRIWYLSRATSGEEESY